MCLGKDLKLKSECYYEKSDVKSLLRVLITDGTSAIIFYRTAQFFRKIHLGIIGYIFIELNKIINGCVIGRKTDFGEGFVLMHPIGVVINSGVVGGENIIIESSVVIGAKDNGLPVKVPKLGNNIFIGSGAKILGGITIGNNVKIGANAVVTRDVPDNSVAVGIPARNLRKDESK